MDIEDLPLIGPEGVNGIVPPGAQEHSLPIGIDDTGGPALFGRIEFYRYVCEHCKQPYNIRTNQRFQCVGCGKVHETITSSAYCIVFGCLGRTVFERDITEDGKPCEREHGTGEEHNG